MIAKRVALPDHQLDVKFDTETKKVNTFIHLAGVVLEQAQQKTDTETYLAHKIREKLDALKPTDMSLDLDEAEIDFLQNSLKRLREKDQITGSAWYYLITGLRDATPIV